MPARLDDGAPKDAPRHPRLNWLGWFVMVSAVALLVYAVAAP